MRVKARQMMKDLNSARHWVTEKDSDSVTEMVTEKDSVTVKQKHSDLKKD